MTYKIRILIYFAGTRLEAGLCHEMGHTLDLSHSTRRSSIMYPNIGRKKDGFSLGSDEIQKIQQLYGGPNGKVSSRRGSHATLYEYEAQIQ